MSYKELKRKEKLLNRDLAKLKKDNAVINKNIILKKREISKVTATIKNFTSNNIVVSEHAVLRFLERHEGINIEDVKATILSDAKIVEAIKTLGSGDFPTAFGTLRVKDNVVITIIKTKDGIK